jgi:hypothetical protein
MWNLPLDKVAACLGGTLPPIAIETGTCRGHGTRALATRFARVITIELSEELHRLARERWAGPEMSHVEFRHGNSARLLPSVLQDVDADTPVFIFLDAHWSGDRSVDWERSTWKGYGIDTAHLGTGALPSGQEQCPLESELRAIMAHCQGPAILLIDDLKNLPPEGPGLRDHEFAGENWSHLSRGLLRSILEPRLLHFQELSDPDQWLVSLAAQNRDKPCL